MYHDVYDHDISESGFQRDRDMLYKVSALNFEEHIQSIERYRQENGLNKDFVNFTFDDGGKSFYTVIAPILEKYGYKGEFFISTQYINSPTFMSEDEIKELSDRGHTIGSHAHSHIHLYTLSPEKVFKEWSESLTILSKILNKNIFEASIPNGDISRKVIYAAHSAGIKYLYSSEPSVSISNYKDMEIIGRFVVLGTTSTTEIMSILTSRRWRFILAFRRFILRCIKNILGESYLSLKKILIRK